MSLKNNVAKSRDSKSLKRDYLFSIKRKQRQILFLNCFKNDPKHTQLSSEFLELTEFRNCDSQNLASVEERFPLLVFGGYFSPFHSFRSEVSVDLEAEKYL